VFPSLPECVPAKTSPPSFSYYPKPQPVVPAFPKRAAPAISILFRIPILSVTMRWMTAVFGLVLPAYEHCLSSPSPTIRLRFFCFPPLCFFWWWESSRLSHPGPYQRHVRHVSHFLSLSRDTPLRIPRLYYLPRQAYPPLERHYQSRKKSSSAWGGWAFSRFETLSPSRP